MAVAIVLARLGGRPLEATFGVTGGVGGGAAERAVDRIHRDFPPDVPFGFGTSAPRILAALRAHDLDAAWVHGGWFGARAARARDALVAHLATGRPAIVCVDHGRLDGAPFVAHWAVAIAASDDGVMLENVRRPSPIPWHAFMAAWRARQLPFGYNHCALLVRG